jgi:hypothetical protein
MRRDNTTVSHDRFLSFFGSLNQVPIITVCNLLINIKLSLGFTKHHDMKTYWGSGCILDFHNGGIEVSGQL